MKKLILALLIIGGINWGLIGFFKYNLVDSIFGPDFFAISRIIYAVVGLAACLLYTSVSFLSMPGRFSSPFPIKRCRAGLCLRRKVRGRRG